VFITVHLSRLAVDAWISGKVLLFRSPDHPITRDHPIPIRVFIRGKVFSISALFLGFCSSLISVISVYQR
jgi:hypothetical protein